jgi:hypothetical protein
MCEDGRGFQWLADSRIMGGTAGSCGHPGNTPLGHFAAAVDTTGKRQAGIPKTVDASVLEIEVDCQVPSDKSSLRCPCRLCICLE